MDLIAKWLNPLRHLGVLSAARISYIFMGSNAKVMAAIIALICLFCFYFRPGCSATGSRSSKSCFMNDAGMHTAAAGKSACSSWLRATCNLNEVDKEWCIVDSVCRSQSLHFSPIVSVRPVNKKSFLQHVEDLCANDNSKFQEEFSVNVCLQTRMTRSPQLH